MTKGKKLEQRYINASWGEVEVDLDMDNGLRGSNIEECGRIKILGQEKHTSRRSKLINFSLIAFDMCTVICLLALHKF
jgi:hypothetical protein